MSKVIGYVYNNGLWYRQYASGKMEVCSEQEIVEHIKRVEKSKEVDE